MLSRLLPAYHEINLLIAAVADVTYSAACMTESNPSLLLHLGYGAMVSHGKRTDP